MRRVPRLGLKDDPQHPLMLPDWARHKSSVLMKAPHPVIPHPSHSVRRRGMLLMSAWSWSQKSDLVGPPAQVMEAGWKPLSRIVSSTSSVPKQMDSSKARCMWPLPGDEGGGVAGVWGDWGKRKGARRRFGMTTHASQAHVSKGVTLAKGAHWNTVCQRDKNT